VKIDQDESNNDLVWSLGHIKKAERAKKFVKLFERHICVYSPTVNQLYGEYEIFFPSSSGGRMVVLPDTSDYSMIFNRIPEQAIVSTNLYFIPGECVNKSGVFIMLKSTRDPKATKIVPLKPGLKVIQSHFGDAQPFLPILQKGDLREFDAAMPCLHLHRIKMSEMADISKLESSNIKNIIIERLALLQQQLSGVELIPKNHS